MAVLSISTAEFEIYLNIRGTLEPYMHPMLFISVMVTLAFILRSPSKKTKNISRFDVEVQGENITTIEGLAKGGELDPIWKMFIKPV